MPDYKTPGVYQEEIFPPPAVTLRTGVPAFLGYSSLAPKEAGPRLLTIWPQFAQNFGASPAGGYLAQVVHGFFENGGELCYVVRLDEQLSPVEALRHGLEEIAPLNTLDLVCAPDVMMNPSRVIELQKMVLEHCEQSGNRFAILDAVPPTALHETLESSLERVLEQRHAFSYSAGALYYPWLGMAANDRPGKPGMAYVPPCGHIAGAYARNDLQFGVHKAPANEALEGVWDLSAQITDAEQGDLNQNGINCLRAFPGRGIRVWGARTLSNQPDWKYINVKRLFLTVGRWIERHLLDAVFEPNTAGLWARLEREIGVYLESLYQRGMLQGSTPEEAFYVKCDAETNTPEVRDLGQVVVEIGLAPSVPAEFVVARIIHDASGVTLSGPERPTHTI